MIRSSASVKVADCLGGTEGPPWHLRRFTQRKVTNSLVAGEMSRVARLANRTRPHQDVALRRGRAKCEWQRPPVRRVEAGAQLPAVLLPVSDWEAPKLLPSGKAYPAENRRILGCFPAQPPSRQRESGSPGHPPAGPPVAPYSTESPNALHTRAFQLHCWCARGCFGRPPAPGWRDAHRRPSP